MVAVFLNFELDLHLNLDLNLDSNKLDLGLGLELARGQRSGAPNFHDLKIKDQDHFIKITKVI